MTSGYSEEFIHGNSGNRDGFSHNFHQQPPQQEGMMLREQIGQRRVDLSLGKRSFGDYYSSQQQPIQFLSNQLQQRQQELSTMSQNQFLMRSIKQRSHGFSSNNVIKNNNSVNNIHNTINYNNCSTEIGGPVHPKQTAQSEPDTGQRNNPTNNSFISTNINTNQIINPGQTSGFGGTEVDAGISNAELDFLDLIEGDEELKELKKHLFGDEEDVVAKEGDVVSDITNSEWAVENFINPSLNPNPNPEEPINNNENKNNDNVVTPSSGGPITVPVTISAKQLIAETATAISEEKNDVVTEFLSKLAQIGDMKGNSEQRLVYYMHNALRSCALRTEYPPPVDELYTADQMSAVYSLFNISPCFKFGLLAANLIMLEAITIALSEGVKIIHVVDFDVGQGAQYINLLRALAERNSNSVQVKITIVETEVGNEGGVPDSVRDELVSLAERVGLNLKYSCVTRAIHELTRESIGCEEGEAVMVNFAFKLYRVPDESVTVDNLRDELLRRVKDFSPRVVTLIEQDLNGNTAPFMIRVTEAWGYYGALFDSLEAILPRENLDRSRVENGMGRKMGNMIACEGKNRVERAEVSGKWRARLGMAGFELKAINKSVVESMRAKLDSAKGGNPGFTVKEENGGVGFGWMGRNLTNASAWR